MEVYKSSTLKSEFEEAPADPMFALVPFAELASLEVTMSGISRSKSRSKLAFGDDKRSSGGTVAATDSLFIISSALSLFFGVSDLPIAFVPARIAVANVERVFRLANGFVASIAVDFAAADL